MTLADRIEALRKAAQDVVDNTYVGQHHRPVSESSRYGNYEARYYHRLAAALRAMEASDGQ